MPAAASYFSLVLNIILVFVIIFLIFKLKKYSKDYFALNNYIKKVITVVSHVRYGSLKTKVEKDCAYNKITTELSENLNSMFESISDRDEMIQEYISKEKETHEMKADFIATLTHDLKVPIIAQDKTFDLFLNNKFGDLTQIQQEAIENLKVSNMDLKYLIESLLETYKFDQAGLELNIEKDVKIVQTVEEFISQIEPVALAHSKKINFHSEIDPNTAVNMDVFLIKRVVQNLILNALTYSQNTDYVDVVLAFDAKNDKNFIINVKDYGCGIEQEEIKKVFNKYYSGTTKFSKSGTGLGLYLSNKIVQSHHGKIEVVSKFNAGSTFSVILPRNPLQ